MPDIDHAVGAVLGSAVGDALGAPFEFGLPGVFRERFPDGVGELCGGGGWEPGEATDDTQMAVLVGESLLERGGLDLPDVFARFRRWAAADPKDIGLQTEQVLLGGDPWDVAAALHFQVNGRAAGNGSLMRASTSAVYFATRGRDHTMEAARRPCGPTPRVGNRPAGAGRVGTRDGAHQRRLRVPRLDPHHQVPSLTVRVQAREPLAPAGRGSVVPTLPQALGFARAGGTPLAPAERMPTTRAATPTRWRP
ncbi:ADP-ribosylglycohydrolase family protein [Streptomyces sp. NPDC097704]|uniref:ADP-ribosylglycohydrolase family protein n=1 Tax=Streptomyces sp. NPDC097704 TaxID=3157101 RepID=UPI00332AF01A